MHKSKTVKKNIGLLRIAMLLLTVGLIQPSCELISPNKPPFAEVLSPLGVVTLNVGEVDTILVNAYDVDGHIVEVQFLIEDVMVYGDQTEPYEFPISEETFDVGSHSLTITAYDNDEGFYTISKQIEISPLGVISAGRDTVFTDGTKSYILQGVLPENGAGEWSTVPAGLGVFSNKNDKNAVFNGFLCQAYELRWTVTQGSSVDSDYVSITFSHPASDAIAGEDVHYSDNRSSTILDAYIPTNGEGRWRIVTGLLGVLDDPENPKSSFIGRPCQDYYLEWSVSTACETKRDTITVRFDQVGIQADAGQDQTIGNGAVSTFLEGNDPGLFDASWEILSGEGGELEDPTDPHSKFLGRACETYVLIYKISSGCGFSKDELTIKFSDSPSIADAGADLSFNDGRTIAFLDANDPMFGEGYWTIMSGSDGIMDDPTDSGSRFMGQACETYLLTWTISAGCGSTSDDIIVAFGHEPTVAVAGADQFITNGVLTTTLAGNMPLEGQGTWTIINGNGGYFSNQGDPHSQFTGQLCESYILQWKISTDCSESFDQIKVEYDQVEIPSYAGPDQAFFDGTTSVTLNANDPTSATGSWQILNGYGWVFADVNDPTSLFSGRLGQVYILRWAISSACGSSTDEVKIGFLSKGTLNDSRNGVAYSTISIGDQEWMAENLNYRIANTSWSYKESSANKQEYGMLYTFEAAQQACPTGWHLPTDVEWRELEINLGMTSESSLLFGYRGDTEGADLKEKGFTHWMSPNMNAVNFIGYTALPGGYRDKAGNYGLLGTWGAFWTAKHEVSSGKAIYRGLHKDKSDIGRDWFEKQNAISVRCVKD